MLKFQIWHSRFHLAYLILFSPFVALVMMQSAPRWVRAAVAGSVFAFALVCLRCNEARPIFHPRFAGLPRERQYLDLHGADWNEPTRRIAEDIVAAGCANVGLKLGFDAFEYPLWLMLRNRGFAGRLDHFGVEHESARIPSSAPPPDVIIAKLSEPPEAVRQRYPFRTDYPPLMLLWAEKPPAPLIEERVRIR